MKQTSGQIAIILCNFFSNSLAYNPSNYLYASGLYVDNVEQISQFSVVLSRFHDNRCGLFVCSYATIINSVVFDSSISIKDTKFSVTRGGVLPLNTSSSVVKLSNINVYNNSGRGINIIMHKVNNLSYAFINITSCYFQSNKSPLVILVATSDYHGFLDYSVVIEIANSTFINNLAVALDLHMLNPGDVHRQIREVGAVSVVLLSFGSVNLSNCTFSANLNGALGVHLSPPYCGKRQHLTFSDVMVYNTNDSSTMHCRLW